MASQTSFSIWLQMWLSDRDGFACPDGLLLQGAGGGGAFLLVLLDLSLAFDTIDHGVFLGRLAVLGFGAILWSGSSPVSPIGPRRLCWGTLGHYSVVYFRVII